jgi:hypothetical protein
MKCAGCSRELEVGDRYIKDAPSGFMRSLGKTASSEGIDDILSTLLGGDGLDIFYCEDCTEPGGDYLYETVYGDEDDQRSRREA